MVENVLIYDSETNQVEQLDQDFDIQRVQYTIGPRNRNDKRQGRKRYGIETMYFNIRKDLVNVCKMKKLVSESRN